MGKDRNFTGQPVYNQLLNFVKRAEIEKISRNTTGSEAYVKKLDGYTHLVVMLFGVMKHFDSLRELEIGMKAEAHKLHHLGIDYLTRRSTLAEANKRRSQEFFAEVYRHLLHQYAPFLADSRNKTATKEWERLLYMMDSTTISLFDNILKGVGRHPKSGKKKGGMKVHTLMKYDVGVPMVVQLTSAANHDHYLLKEVHLPKSSILAVDRAYIDIAKFERLTEEGVCYVTKMKKNLKFEVLKSTTYVSPDWLVTHKDQNIMFDRGELKHYSRRVELWSKDSRKSVVLLTNNFKFSVEDIAEIYKRRWAIETLYKQLKQNFQLHFFYGDSVNAIQIQTWVTLIANLLCAIVSRMIKRRCSFSQVVTMARLMLMYYVDFIAFMEAPDAS
ncbi:MAG: IS4 family transposase [Rikenellaceae bacterium]